MKKINRSPLMKLIALLCVTVLTMSLLAGCAGSGSKADATAKSENTASSVANVIEATSHAVAPKNGEKYRIAFIVKSMQSAFFLNMLEGAEACASDLGSVFELTTMAPETPFDVDQQIQLVENCIANDYDAIVLTPCDSTGIIPAIEACNKAGIPVITPNTRANGGEVIGYVGIDNHQVGYVVGKAVCDALGGSGNVLLMEGISGNSTSEDRKAGFIEALNESSNVKLLDSQPADWDREKAMTVTENWLQTYDKIDAIFTMTKDMGLGSLQAIDQAGRSKEIMSFTFDIDDDVKEALLEGTLTGTCNQNERSQGYMALVEVIAYMRGYEVPAEATLPATILTASDFQ